MANKIQGILGGIVFLWFIFLSLKIVFKTSPTPTPTPTPNPTPPNPTPPEESLSLLRRYKNEWVENKQNNLLNYDGLLELVKNKNINSIGYRDLLNCYEWQFKRFKILFRDKFSCADCGHKSYSLHVHHKFYLVAHLPWEIDDTGLVSLCRNCHSRRHQNEDIKIYEIVQNRKVLSNNFYFTSCSRCYGTGYLPEFHYYENGICFRCHGNFISQTIFSRKINYIINNPTEYNTNESFDESFAFFESIIYDYYENNIFNKLEQLTQEEEIDDLPF